jgi:hypothetical protein
LLFLVQLHRLQAYLPSDMVKVYQEQFGMRRELYDWQVLPGSVAGLLDQECKQQWMIWTCPQNGAG